MNTRSAVRSNFFQSLRRSALRLSLFLVRAAGIVSVLSVVSSALAQNRLQVTRLPAPEGTNSAALGINNKGEVVGYSYQGENYQAFLYSSSDQSMIDVGSLGGQINAACAINDSGKVTGYSQDANGNILAFLFSRDQPITSLGTLEGASTSEAFGINKSGAVVGDSQSGAQNHRPVLFSKNSVQDLGLGNSNDPDALETAYAINDAGQIVGRHSAGNNAFHAFSYLNGTTTDFSTLGGTNGEALAINRNGVVVGDSDTADGSPHAFVFDHSKIKDLGTLPGFEAASYARGINTAGDIVGESDSADQKRAFLFTKGRLIELDKLAGNLSEAGFSSLDVAYGINDKGWIVGYGTTTDNLTSAFVAVPEGSDNSLPAAGAPRPPRPGVAAAPPPDQDLDTDQSGSGSDQDDYDLFYSRLSSEDGNWVDAGDYGYCFRPRVAADWRPYEDGHWVWTDQGWYWDSNERFGWATYHYGRWANINGTGWCWVPGNKWAPAWVSWRESDDHVGWAPLPPEADFTGNRPISSWSDSYYGIGPAAYAFISYSNWRQPSYSRYIERPDRNVQIIRETRNVTNIVTDNNMINNFGPPVQTVARRSNQNIPQVRLAVNRAGGPRANFGQTLQGNQLNVIAPPATLNAQARRTPAVQNRIQDPRVEKGWQGVKPEVAQQLRQEIAAKNPAPQDLPKPTPFVTRRPGNQLQPAGAPAAPGGAIPAPAVAASPAQVPGQKTPANLLRPGARPPGTGVAPGASPNVPALATRPVPPNLLGKRPPGAPGAAPQTKPPGTPGGSPSAAGVKPAAPGLRSPNQPPGAANVPTVTPNPPKGIPPNLNTAKPSTAVAQPGVPGNQPGPPAPKPAGNPPSDQVVPRVSPNAPNVPAPGQQKRLQTLPKPTPRGGPAIPVPPNPTPAPPAQEGPKPVTPPPAPQSGNQANPKPVPQVKVPPREVSTPPPVAVPAPPQPQQQTLDVKPTVPPKQQAKTPTPEARPTPAPQARVEPAAVAKPPAQKIVPPKQPVKAPAPQVQHRPAPPPQVSRPPAPKPAAQAIAAAKPQAKAPPPPVPRPQAAARPQPPAAHNVPAKPAAQKAAAVPKKPQQPQKAPPKGKPTPEPQ